MRHFFYYSLLSQVVETVQPHTVAWLCSPTSQGAQLQKLRSTPGFKIESPVGLCYNCHQHCVFLLALNLESPTKSFITFFTFINLLLCAWGKKSIYTAWTRCPILNRCFNSFFRPLQADLWQQCSPKRVLLSDHLATSSKRYTGFLSSLTLVDLLGIFHIEHIPGSKTLSLHLFFLIIFLPLLLLLF